jgi:hypothetical protein
MAEYGSNCLACSQALHGYLFECLQGILRKDDTVKAFETSANDCPSLLETEPAETTRDIIGFEVVSMMLSMSVGIDCLPPRSRQH